MDNQHPPQQRIQPSGTAQPPMQPLSPSPPPSWKSKKMLILAGIILLLGIIIGSIYLLRQNKQNNLSSSSNFSPTVWPTAPLPTKPPTPTPLSLEVSNTATANWKTYIDEQRKYQLQYPPNPLQPMRAEGDTSFVVGYFIDGGTPNNFQDVQNSEKTYWIRLSYISESQLSVMGIDYCEANSNDVSRCETVAVNGINSLIDWEIPVEYSKMNSEGKEEKATQLKALVKIPHPKGGMITLELQPVVSKSKETLYKILSTFKFN